MKKKKPITPKPSRETKRRASQRMEALVRAAYSKAVEAKAVDCVRHDHAAAETNAKWEPSAEDLTACNDLAEYYANKGDIRAAKNTIREVMNNAIDDEIKLRAANSIIKYGMEAVKIKSDAEASKDIKFTLHFGGEKIDV